MSTADNADDADNASNEERLYISPYTTTQVDLGSPSGMGHDGLTPRHAASKASSNYVPFLDRLRALPELRPIPWRTGQELPPERAVDSPRVQQRGATLLSTRGSIAKAACEHCASGYGRFSVCVTMEYWFQGACSSCIFTSKGNKCSLRAKTSGSADGRALRYQAENPDQNQASLPGTATLSVEAPKKRKRSSAATLAVKTAPYASPYPPQLAPSLPASPGSSASRVAGFSIKTASTYSSPYPQLAPPLPASPDLDMDMLLQAEIAREQSHMEQERSAKSQAYSNQPQSNVARPRAPSRAGHPSYQQQTESHEPIATGLSSLDQPSVGFNQLQSATPISQGPSVLGNLPKAKRRQIHSIVAGIQGSIDHLQRQLDTLKSHIGIGEEDLVG